MAASSPPPPPIGYSPAYPGGLLWLPPVPRGSATHQAVHRIREGIHTFLIANVVALVSGVFAFALSLLIYLVGIPFLLGGFPFGGPGAGMGPFPGNSSAPMPPAFPVSLVLLIVFGIFIGILGLIEFILVIIAWIRWRQGVKDLVPASWEYGPLPHQGALDAEMDYSYTVLFFILGLVALILGASLLVALAFVSVGSPATGLATFVTYALLVGGVYFLLEFFMYYYASRSLLRGIWETANPGIRQKLDSGRLLMLVGGAFAGAGFLSSLLRPVGFIGFLGPLFLVWGLMRFESAYNEWLAFPPPCPPAPATAPGFGGSLYPPPLAMAGWGGPPGGVPGPFPPPPQG